MSSSAPGARTKKPARAHAAAHGEIRKEHAMTNPLPDAQLAHVGLFVRDLEAMIAFYTRVLGLVVTDSGDYYMGGRIAFLSRNADEHHQIVMASGRAEGSPTTLNQLSFRVNS